MGRVCSRCKQRKNAEEFYASHRSWCKACIRVYMHARRVPKREVLPVGSKRCPTCQHVLPVESFRKRKAGRPYAYCRPCQRLDNETRRRADTGYPRGPLGSNWAMWRQTGRQTCPRCSTEKPISEFAWQQARQRPYGWCRACSRASHKAWLKTEAGRAAMARFNRKRYDSQPVKARAFTFAAIRLGVLVRQPCEVCGVNQVEAHHVDYSRPLEVQWLCAIHHRVKHHKGDQ